MTLTLSGCYRIWCSHSNVHCGCVLALWCGYFDHGYKWPFLLLQRKGTVTSWRSKQIALDWIDCKLLWIEICAAYCWTECQCRVEKSRATAAMSKSRLMKMNERLQCVYLQSIGSVNWLQIIKGWKLTDWETESVLLYCPPVNRMRRFSPSLMSDHNERRRGNSVLSNFRLLLGFCLV